MCVRGLGGRKEGKRIDRCKEIGIIQDARILPLFGIEVAVFKVQPVHGISLTAFE